MVGTYFCLLLKGGDISQGLASLFFFPLGKVNVFKSYSHSRVDKGMGKGSEYWGGLLREVV